MKCTEVTDCSYRGYRYVKEEIYKKKSEIVKENEIELKHFNLISMLNYSMKQ